MGMLETRQAGSLPSCRCMSRHIKPPWVQGAQPWEIAGFSHVCKSNAVQQAQDEVTGSIQGAASLTSVRVNT